MLAARGGAAAVVGLDGSERMAGLASAVVTANGLDAASGGPVTILAGRAEDVCDLGHTKVSCSLQHNTKQPTGPDCTTAASTCAITSTHL